MRLTWVQPEDLLPHELAACRDEGRDVAAVEHAWIKAGGSLVPPAGGASAEPATPRLRALAEELLDRLAAVAATAPLTPAGDQVASLSAEQRPGYHGSGSAGSDAAVASMGAEQRRGRRGPGLGGDLAAPASVGAEQGSAGFDRVHGAWLGRAAGCLLGKPVEKIPREGIREILEAAGRWPLANYFTAIGVPDAVLARWPWNRRSALNSLAENIDGMPEDDDLNFTLLALYILETYGPEFSSVDVAQAWLDWLPAGRVFTAERVAYRNLLLGLTPPQTATRRNPFREWIGAQIRADVYGWANPGRPALAAAMAQRDAAISHVGDGIRGAMWVAAMTSVAPVVSSVEEVLDAGESVLPVDSRLGRAVREARVLGSTEPEWERIVDRLYAEHGHLHWVHVRNNASLVAAALAHGRGDYSRSICAVVSGGWDTDSNGATVGSVAGALAGAAALPPQWTKPLHDTLHSSIGFADRVTFTELAERTLRLGAGT